MVVDSAAVVLYYPAPRSATGEDVLELHIHGGPATQKAVLSAISKVASNTRLPIRYAEPGEFTKRAFINQKLDLAQVEALSDEISAETEQQRRAAVRGNSQKLCSIYEDWREKLLHARGEIEALIDFSEDQSFEESPKSLFENVTNQVNVIIKEAEKHKFASQRAELLKRGIKISLLGPANSGKSSLLNIIVGREASIVSQEVGTTRDVIEASIDLKGYLCSFADTAGLRDEHESKNSQSKSIGVAELEGIKRAKMKAKSSDIVVVMTSIELSDSPNNCLIKYDAFSLSLAAKTSNVLIVINKIDLIDSPEKLRSIIHDFKSNVVGCIFPTKLPPIIQISCYNHSHGAIFGDDKSNIQVFLSELVKYFKKMTNLPPYLEDLIGVTERQKLILDSFCSQLQEFKDETDIVLAAENLRLAAMCLNKITGRGNTGDVEELLGVIFEKFASHYLLGSFI